MPLLSLTENRALEHRAQLVVAQRAGDTLVDPEWILGINSFSDHGAVRQRLDPDFDNLPRNALQDPLSTEKLDRARLLYTERLFRAARKWAGQHGNGHPSIGHWGLKRLPGTNDDPPRTSFRIDLLVDVYICQLNSGITVWLGEDRYSCALSALLAIGSTAKKTVTQAMTEQPAYRRDLIRWLGREKPLE